MKRITWRYRPRRGWPLGDPVGITLTDREWQRFTKLRAKLATVTGDERTKLLNEITTLIDIKAVFPEAIEVRNGSV